MKFLREAAIMGQFLHNNVVRLHVVVTEGENMMIILEYMPKGNLCKILLKMQMKYEIDETSLNINVYRKDELKNDRLPLILQKYCRQIRSSRDELCILLTNSLYTETLLLGVYYGCIIK